MPGVLGRRLTTEGELVALLSKMKRAKDSAQAALQVLLAARREALEGLGLTRHRLGPLAGPARKEHIDLLERALAKALPPSFRSFLELHDGIREFDLGSDLLGARRIAELYGNGGPKRLKKILDEIERDAVDGLVIFGTTKGDASLFIFDSNKADRRGEWPVLEYDADDGLLDEYPDFVAFLNDTADTLRMMLVSVAPPPPARSTPPKKKAAPPKKKERRPPR